MLKVKSTSQKTLPPTPISTQAHNGPFVRIVDFFLREKQVLLRWSSRILSVAVLFVISCDKPTSPEDTEALPAIDVPWTDQHSVVCFGTSLTYGFIWRGLFGFGPEFSRYPQIPPFSPFVEAVASPSYAYPELLGATLKIRVHNQGIVGATTQDALEIVGDSVFARNPALVLLEFGANDLLQSFDVQTLQDRLGRLIDTLHAYGSKVVLISFLHAEMIESIPPDHFLANRKSDGRAYLETLRRVASNHTILFVEFAMKEIYWNKDLMSDSIHPNEAGYRKMQENISRALVKTFAKNGMLK